MLLLRTGQTGDEEGSDQAMNALAIVYVNTHLQSLLDEAAEHRHNRADRPSLFERIRSAASKAGASLAMPLDNRGTFFPTLDGSPHR
jgi:hypothetical protein